jgi:hypothetical protein
MKAIRREAVRNTWINGDRRPFQWALTASALAATLMVLTPPAMAGPKGTITVRPLGTAKITLDGDFSDWPLARFGKPTEQPAFPEGQNAGATTGEGDHIVFDAKRVGLFNGTPEDAFTENESDFGATVYFAHDTKFLYMLAVFIDDQIRDDRDESEFGSTGYLNDGFEFFFDTLGDSKDCVAEGADFKQSAPYQDDMQITVGLNKTFKPSGAADTVLGARQTLERAGNLGLIGPDKGGPGGIYRDALTASGQPDIAARSYADLRAAGAKNPEIAANPNVKYTGYAIEMRIPFDPKIPGFSPDHRMGFELFWRDVDADDVINWFSWAQSTTVVCSGEADDPKTALFNAANWATLAFDTANPLGQ